jgi:hypothetical protein
MMGGALGLAVLASAAASRTDALLADGETPAAALTGGYHLAFLAGAVFAAVAAALGGLLLCARPARAATATRPPENLLSAARSRSGARVGAGRMTQLRAGLDAAHPGRSTH